MAGPGAGVALSPVSLPPTIEVMPQGGLSARLRATASAIAFAATQQAPVAISWVNQLNIFAAPAALLFDLTGIPYWATVTDLLTPPDSIWDTARQIDRQEQFPYYLQTLGWRRPIRVKTGAALIPDYIDYLRLIAPAPDIAALRAQVFGQIIGRTLIGVHIRAGTDPMAANTIPAAFWTAMEAILAADPAALFYVASDTQSVREEAAMRFPDHILLGFASLLGRNDPYGSFQDAVDFFCLAGTSKILGTPGAGFGQLAAEYAGIPFEIITRS